MKKKIVSFGEIMLKLTPSDNSMLCDTKSFTACYGGSEANVLVCLSSLGDKTEYLTAVPKNELGAGVIKHLKSYGVGTDNIIKKGDSLGMYFLQEGFGKRPNKVIYNRKQAVVNSVTTDEFCYDEIFNNCNLFHVCGISFCISENAKKLCFRFLEEAKKRNILISFDFNYRAKLCSMETAKLIYQEIIKYVDILFCSEQDLASFLDIDKKNFYSKYKTKYLIVREREILENGRHSATAEIFFRENEKVISEIVFSDEFPVIERIGSGDAFAGGVLHGLINGKNIKDALSFGMECFVLKHTIKGDVFSLKENEIEDLINKSKKDVCR